MNKTTSKSDKMRIDYTQNKNIKYQLLFDAIYEGIITYKDIDSNDERVINFEFPDGTEVAFKEDV